ncbi:hypothetical protein O6H91_07G019800 [Diphasiastrum complanatum]|uniref:Uncharacterized protein n=1 Tax=Diphasiastrum complanatum TaxID=34168 RepID=A0ACC2D2X7_DIPCM|nr:hypothetical protein O6H91_07G019800 [Diphasiastrum complanatum]
MGIGIWTRLKDWMKNRVLGFGWIVIRSRVFRKIRGAVSACMIPFTGCAAGGAAGAGIAAALVGEGILLGVVITAAVFVLVKAYRETTRQRASLRHSITRVSLSTKDTSRKDRTRT